MFYVCIVYADDILLLAPSLRALRHMLNICSIFADDNNIRINQAKSHCLHFCKFNTAIKQYPVELQGTALTWTDHIAHLGHILCSSLDDSMDIDKRKQDFCSQANYKLFLCSFSSFVACIKKWTLSNLLSIILWFPNMEPSERCY